MALLLKNAISPRSLRPLLKCLKLRTLTSGIKSRRSAAIGSLGCLDFSISKGWNEEFRYILDLSLPFLIEKCVSITSFGQFPVPAPHSAPRPGVSSDTIPSHGSDLDETGINLT
ncbi:hypothetical protein EVAR_15927_1 [Eumeta japonica]|uniref:Uncharacterized protein n=1 Tax=Eumeta variegata TaxID=151549 RepID=A0A4C1UMP8_EUMVA|nr:hypothetical protein EVAR_15927_1 [Eumeta japonica]